MKDSMSDHIEVTGLLDTAVVPTADRSLAMLLSDTDEAPTDLRVRRVTTTGYVSGLEAGGIPLSYASDFWMQELKASELMFGRWIKAASYGYAVQKDMPSKNPEDYETLGMEMGFQIAVDTILAGAATLVDDIAFGGVSTFGGALDAINAVIQTVSSGAYAGYYLQLDSVGRLICAKTDDVGSAALEVTISSNPAAGDDIAGPAYLNMAGGFWAPGKDPETPTEAIQAIREIDDDWYCITERGASADEKVEISTIANASRKICVLWEDTLSSCNDKDSLTQAFARIHALSHRNTFMIYDPGSIVNNADAVIVGAYLPAEEGTVGWSNTRLFNAASSNIGSDNKKILKDQNIQWFETEPRSNVTTNPYGLTASNDEMRWIVGRNWFTSLIQSEVFTLKIRSKGFGFNIPTFGALESIIRVAGKAAIRRGFAVDTKKRPFVVSLPDPDDFTTADRAAHAVTLDKVYRLPLDSEIYDIAILGSLTL